MTIKECKDETLKHISNVKQYISIITNQLKTRAIMHDYSKLESPEIEIFTEYTPKLASAKYGSKEYQDYLKGMNVVLEHHYSNNRHHPEFFENGISDMNLVDTIEMLCDWKAASLRHKDGNLTESIEFNQNRFKYSDEFKSILLNTAKLFD